MLLPSLVGRNPPFWAVKRPAHPCKTAIQNRFTVENAKGASPPREGPDRAGAPFLPRRAASRRPPRITWGSVAQSVQRQRYRIP
jgi:hypothetical protein